MEQRRHICKLCKKTFLSGKVLGGHMRSHGAKNSAKPEKKLKMGSLEIEGDEDEPAGYGLRANPKRSWKFSGSKVEALREEEILCKVCGKKFDSMKALFGHMRHHSGKERKETQCCKVCGKGFESLKALTAHTKSHSKRLRACDESEKISGGKLFVECQCSSETMGLIRRKRSKRLRYKIAPNSSFSSVNESAYVSEFGQEVFDGAICLMMISRIGINWGRISTVTESSSNNSLSVEVQSPGQKNGIMESKGGISVCDDVGSFKISKVKMQKLVDCLSDCENVSAEKKVFEFGENESGSGFSDEENIVKFKVPIDRFYRGTEYKKRKLDEESAFMLHEMKTNPTVVEMDVDIIEEVELGSMKSGLTKKARLNACDSGKNMINATQSKLFADSEKKEHKCRRCDKVFRSYQALGGHQRGHKANKNCSVMKIEDCEDIIQINRLSKTQYNCNPAIAKLECSDNSVEQEMETLTVTGTESKGHTCSICLKVFATGQALGGHKRVHFGKDSETGFEQTQTLKQQISDICGAFDLSHAVELEEEKGDVEFNSWCVGDEHKHNLLVG